LLVSLMFPNVCWNNFGFRTKVTVNEGKAEHLKM
jgi:hypothetical protein